ncbi:MAG TPA: alpha/beta hydrolase [Thermoanaerobaculia bacterium]
MTARSLRVRGSYLAIRAIEHLPDRVKIWLSGTAPVIVDGQQLDPQLQFLRSLRSRQKRPGLVEPTIDAGRARYRRETLAFRGPVTKVGAVRDIEIPGADGPLRARHYAPADGANAPLTVYFHGGGFCIGDLDTHDEACRLLCRYAAVHVLSVEYRLAPEHPFPAALDDATAALAWAQANAATLGANPANVSVGGDSAGANLSAVVSLLASREKAPRAQLLIYPPTDGHTPRRSYELFGKGFYLSEEDRKAFGRFYGGAERGIDARRSPLHASDLSNLPPALVITAGFDLLRDEGEAYAQALASAGTLTRLKKYSSLGHGFIHMTGVCSAARRAMIDIAREWRAIAG